MAAEEVATPSGNANREPTQPLEEASIFDVARHITSLLVRQQYLQQVCGDDDSLRARVESLLEVYDAEIAPVDDPFKLSSGSGHSSASEEVGSMVGQYKVVEQIGDGGFGVVFLAEQQQPLRRKVALKVLKPGMDTKQVVARFEAERQALALMEHENIARVLDGGETASGRPFFVMELVKGIPITQHCDKYNLSLRERLELFVPVCRAVQHAHQKGIIHRDLKPSNVLVANCDGRPVPKVIDFGVAKALGQQLTDRTLNTSYGGIVGTLEYMSPEQAECNTKDLDTRADIYSLGVLLYELLTGTTPLTRERLKEAALTEVLRLIREEDPPKPSTRISDSTDALATISAQRKLEPARLTKELQGELDWIVMKCLEKDRNRRFETANGLVRDIERYLHDELVEAGPPSSMYRLHKFVSKHRRFALASATVFLALIVGIVGTALGLLDAQAARRAEASRADGEREAKRMAEMRLIQVEKGIDLIGSVFVELDPLAEEAQGRPLRAILGDRLDRAASELLNGDTIGDPLVLSRLLDRLGQTYMGLGSGDRAEKLFAKSVEIRNALLGVNDPLTLESQHLLAVAQAATGHEQKAIDLLKKVHAGRVMILGEEHQDTLSTLYELGSGYARTGNTKEALRRLEEVHSLRLRQLGASHNLTLDANQMLSSVYLMDGRRSEAVDLAEKAWKARVAGYGDDHPLAIAAMANLAHIYQGAYRMRESLDLYQNARDKIVPKLGDSHPKTLAILRMLGHMLRVYKRTPEAITLLEQVRERELMVQGSHHPNTLTTSFHLALTYKDAGKLTTAFSLLQQAAEAVEKLKFEHSHAVLILDNLALCHEALTQYEQAEACRRKCLEQVIYPKDGPDSLKAATELIRIGSLSLLQKSSLKAEPPLRQALKIFENCPNAGEKLYAQSLLGTALADQSRYAEAEPLLLEAYQGMKNFSKEHPGQGTLPKGRRTNALTRLVLLYQEWQKPDLFIEWSRELESMRQDAPPSITP